MNILVINPGSTSTKLAVYNNLTPLFCHSINHSASDLAPFESIAAQKDFRKQIILNMLKEHGYGLEDIEHFVGRGGLVKNLQSGVYRINKAYLKDANEGVNGQHASIHGGILDYELAKEANESNVAYTVDPVVVDECEPIAKISGMPLISRVRAFHALNHKAVARRYATEIGKPYEELSLIVAHLGGGISVGVHQKGRIVDVNSALGGEGAFSPERAGGIPPLNLLEMAFSGKYSYQDLYKQLIGEGGVYAYLGTKDIRDVESMIRNGSKPAKLVLEAMAYQIAKDIGASATVLKGKVDAIIITGGISYSVKVTELIKQSIDFITPNVVIYPGEDEMLALAQGVCDTVNGSRPILTY